MALGPQVTIVLCDARRRDSVKQALTGLVRHVLGTTSELSRN